jgi:glycosyltransferase involved in cell wall biosynthesis
MRILHASHISNFTPPIGYGGIELVVDTLARELVARNHRVRVLGVRPPGVETTYEFINVFEHLVRQPHMWHKLRYSLVLLSQARGFDVIHIHVQWLAPAASVIRRLGKPTLLTLHADPSAKVAGLRVPKVAISETQRIRLEQRGIKPVAVVYNGIDVEKYPFSAEKEDFYLYLGRIDGSKGVHIAVQAARKAGEKLIIIGPVADGEYFRRFVEPYIDGVNIKYLGEVEFGVKVGYLARAKALLFPVQYEEIFGIVMVEALATGTPVIGFARGSVTEIVRHGVTGFLVRDLDEMIKAMKFVDSLDGRECRRDVERRFSSKVMAQRYEELYRKLAGT